MAATDSKMSNPYPPSGYPTPPTTLLPQPTMQIPAPLQRGYQVPGYCDYANVKFEMEEDSLSGLLSATPRGLANRCKSSDLVFPQKVHMLLTAAEQDNELASIISWKVHGRAFAVHDRKRFLKEVLPEWFLQSRFESFQRQLNLYGFRRITTGPDRGSCYHELFLRQKPVLASRIQRHRLKGKGPRKPASPGDEPNFYRMSLLPTYATKLHPSVKPSSPTYDRAMQPPGVVASTNGPTLSAPHPNGLCALMFRPLTYARTDPPATPRVERKPRVAAMPPKPPVVSAPPSPVAPVGVPLKAPALATVVGMPKPPLMALFPRPTQLKLAPLASKLSPSLSSTNANNKKSPVPRIVSHLRLAGDEAPWRDLSDDAFLREETRHEPLAIMEALFSPVEQGNGDEDFALILAELASS